MLPDIDKNYALLVQLRWSGVQTSSLAWVRRAETAIGMFGCAEDASHFIHGYLDWHKAIRKTAHEDVTPTTGNLRETFLPVKTLKELIEIPRRFDAPVEIKIPLDILVSERLEYILDLETRTLGPIVTVLPAIAISGP